MSSAIEKLKAKAAQGQQPPSSGVSKLRLKAAQADPSLWDRFIANAEDAFKTGTLAGSGYTTARAAIDEKFAQEEKQRQAEYAAMPESDTLVEKGVALAGQIAGNIPTPENFVPLSRLFGKGIQIAGKPLLSRAATGAAEAAAVTAVTDPAVQALNVARGAQEEYSPLQTVAGVGLAGIIGGGAKALAGDGTPKVETVQEPVTPKKPKVPPKSEEEVAVENLTGTPVTNVDRKRIFEEAQAGRGRMYPGNLNYDYIMDNIDSGIPTILRSTELEKSGFMDTRRAGTTEEETMLAAKELNLSPEELLQRRKGKNFSSPEEAYAARMLLIQSAEDVVRFAKIAETGTAEDKLKALQVLRTHQAIQEQVAGGTAEAGRTLRQFRIPVGTDITRQLSALTKKFEGQKSPEELFKALGAFMDENGNINTQGLANFADKIKKPTNADKFWEVWYNSLLSGVSTHVVNITSNALTGIWTIPETITASAIGGVRALAAKARGENLTDRVTLKEAAYELKGLLSATQEAAMLAKKAFSDTYVDPSQKIETRVTRAIGTEPNSGAIARQMGKIIRLPSRALSAEDAFFKTIFQRKELYKLAYREANKLGYVGKRADEEAAKLIEAPTKQMLDAAEQAALKQTFQNEPGAIGQGLLSLTEKVPAIRLVIPFVRTPVNIIRYAFERTPGAALFKSYQNATGAEKDMVRGRAVLGTGVMALAGTLAADGVVTGTGPSDFNQKATMRATGWQPNSIKVNDNWISYNRFDPMGLVFGFGADSVEVFKNISEGEATDVASTIIGVVSQNIINKTWLSGLSDAMNAVTDPDRYAEQFIQGLAGTAVPTLVGHISSAWNPEIKDVQGILDMYKNKTGLGKDGIPPRVNHLTGLPMVRDQEGLERMVAPFWRTEDKTASDKALDEIERLGMSIPRPERKLGRSLELTQDQYYKYSAMAGSWSYNRLYQIVHHPEWDKQSPQTKKEIIEYVYKEGRTAGREYLYALDPNLRLQVAWEQYKKDANVKYDDGKSNVAKMFNKLLGLDSKEGAAE